MVPIVAGATAPRLDDMPVDGDPRGGRQGAAADFDKLFLALAA